MEVTEHQPTWVGVAKGKGSQHPNGWWCRYNPRGRGKYDLVQNHRKDAL